MLFTSLVPEVITVLVLLILSVCVTVVGVITTTVEAKIVGNSFEVPVSYIAS